MLPRFVKVFPHEYQRVLRSAQRTAGEHKAVSQTAAQVTQEVRA